MKTKSTVLKSIAVTGALTAAGTVAATTAHADAVNNAAPANAASVSTTNADQQLANLKNQQAASEAQASSANAAKMSAATSAANGQIAYLNNQIKQRRASDAAAHQAKVASATNAINSAAQSAINAENASYSDAVAKQSAANDAELKATQAKAATEQQNASDQENNNFQKSADNLNTEHNQRLNKINDSYQNQTKTINQKLTDAESTDKDQRLANATKQVDDQINNATNAFNQAQNVVNSANADVKDKQNTDNKAQEALKSAEDTLNNAQSALESAKKQLQDVDAIIHPNQPQQVQISQEYINDLPKVTDIASSEQMEAKDPDYSNFFKNSYQSDPYAALESIDINHLTNDQLLQINLYSTRLINQIRAKFNMNSYKLNPKLIQRAQENAIRAGQMKTTDHIGSLLTNLAGENLDGRTIYTTANDDHQHGDLQKASDFAFSKSDNDNRFAAFPAHAITTMDDLQADVFYSIMNMLFVDAGINQDGHARQFLTLYNNPNEYMALGIENFIDDNGNHQMVMRWIFADTQYFPLNQAEDYSTGIQKTLTRTTQTKTISRQVSLNTPTGTKDYTQKADLVRYGYTDSSTGKTAWSNYRGTMPAYQAPQINGLTPINPDAAKEVQIDTSNPQNLAPVTINYRKTSDVDYYKFYYDINYIKPDGTVAGHSNVTITGYRTKNGNTYDGYDNNNVKVTVDGIPLKSVTTPKSVSEDPYPNFLEFQITAEPDLKQLNKYLPGYHFKGNPTTTIDYDVYDENTTPLKGQYSEHSHADIPLVLNSKYDVEDSTSRLQDQIKQLQTKISADSQGVDAAKAKAQTSASDLKNAKNKLNQDKKLLSEAQTKLNDLKINRNKMIQDLAKNPSGLQSQLTKDLQNQLSQIKFKHDTAIKNENDNYTTRLNNLKKNHEAKLTAIAAQSEKIDALKAQLQGKLDTLKKNHEAKLVAIQNDAKAKIDALKKQAMADDPEIDKLQGQINSIKDNLAKQQKKLDDQFAALKAKDEADYNALEQKLKNSSSEAAKGHNDHYNTGDGHEVVLPGDHDGQKGDQGNTTPAKPSDSQSSKGDDHQDQTTPVAPSDNQGTKTDDNHVTKPAEPAKGEEDSNNSAVDNGVVKISYPADNAASVDTNTPAATVTPMTREAVKAQAKNNGKSLPQTGNENGIVAMALGTMLAMFGLGVSAKKRY